MQTVKASVILDDAYRLIGWDADQIDDRDKADARAAFSQALQQVWEAWWWSFLMQCAPVQFADSYADAYRNFYVPDNTVYFPPEDWYFVNLVADAGTAPTDGNGELNYGWARLEYPPNYKTWDDGTTYDIGDDPVNWNGSNWAALNLNTDSEPSDSNVNWHELPDWSPELPRDSIGAPDVDTDDTVVGPYGPWRSVTRFDPRASTNPTHFEFEETEDGTRAIGLTVGRPWIWSRRVTPVISGDDYSATATYEATLPQDLIFDS